MTAPKSLIQTGEDLAVEMSRGKRFAFWDELRGAVTSRFQSGPTANSLAPYGWLALLILTNAVVSTLSGAHDAAQRGAPYSLLRPGYFEGTSVICTLSLLPLFRRGVHLVGRCESWITRLALASLLASLYAVAHIAILIPIRKLSFGIVGGTYTFDWLAQGPYDFRREIIGAMVLGGAFWLFDRKTVEPASPAAGAGAGTSPADEPHLWLRDGTTAVRIDPRDARCGRNEVAAVRRQAGAPDPVGQFQSRHCDRTASRRGFQSPHGQRRTDRRKPEIQGRGEDDDGCCCLSGAA
jgi:hypothetical protein